MIIIISGTLIILFLLILIFRDSYILRDLKLYITKKTKPPSRSPINLRRSQRTDPYEASFSDPKDFSQPRNGKMTQYDFSLPSLPHHSSTYYSSCAFLVNNKVKKPIPSQQLLSDSSIVEHHRFYHDNNKNQNLKIQKQKSSKLPSNQDIYKSATQFHENKSSTSFQQIYSSAENPYVLPAIVKKKEKVEEKPSSTTISATSSSKFSLPPPPPQSSGGSSTTKFPFNFTNFNLPKNATTKSG